MSDKTALAHRSMNEKTANPARKPLVALTGATGFIGQYLVKALPARGYRLRVLLRRPTMLPEGCASAVIGDLAKPYNMAEALTGVDAVIHSAGLASTMSGLPEDDYRLFNTEATVGFAKAAERARVKRFIFLSSIRAQSGPSADGILTEERPPQPTDAYGRSKLAAEQGLAATGLDWVALRLALVYGSGVGGNMARLVKLARSPYPLPLSGLRAKHSLLSLDNLIEAIDVLLASPGPLRRPFIVADREALSFGEIVAALRQGLGRRPALFYVPRPLLRAALRASGQSAICEPLFGSLVADPSALGGMNWSPPVATQQGLAALAQHASS
jgi:nucleoside-diphosphate-sugar epimerase